MPVEPEELAGRQGQQHGERQSDPEHNPEKPENPPARKGRRIFRIGSGTNQGKVGTVRAQPEPQGCRLQDHSSLAGWPCSVPSMRA